MLELVFIDLFQMQINTLQEKKRKKNNDFYRSGIMVIFKCDTSRNMLISASAFMQSLFD